MREKCDGNCSETEDAVLAEMDALWWDLTDEERNSLQSRDAAKQKIAVEEFHRKPESKRNRRKKKER